MLIKTSRWEIIIVEKRDTSLAILGQQFKKIGVYKSIIGAKKVPPVNSEMPEDYLEKRIMSPQEEGFKFLLIKLQITSVHMTKIVHYYFLGQHRSGYNSRFTKFSKR